MSPSTVNIGRGLMGRHIWENMGLMSWIIAHTGLNICIYPLKGDRGWVAGENQVLSIPHLYRMETVN
jgi:hypothetical protein